jgi:hypothetical protein
MCTICSFLRPKLKYHKFRLSRTITRKIITKIIFFHAFSGDLEKATINKIFLTLPSQKEELKFLFFFVKIRRLDLAIRRILSLIIIFIFKSSFVSVFQKEIGKKTIFLFFS